MHNQYIHDDRFRSTKTCVSLLTVKQIRAPPEVTLYIHPRGEHNFKFGILPSSVALRLIMNCGVESRDVHDIYYYVRLYVCAHYSCV